GAASSPCVRAAEGSVGLQSKLHEFSAYTAGLEIQSYGRRRAPAAPVEQLERAANARAARIQRIGRQIGSAPPVTTAITPPIGATAGENFTQIRLTARDGALAHVTVLSQARGDGLWISDIAAGPRHVAAGDPVQLPGAVFRREGDLAC